MPGRDPGQGPLRRSELVLELNPEVEVCEAPSLAKAVSWHLGIQFNFAKVGFPQRNKLIAGMIDVTLGCNFGIQVSFNRPETLERRF